jgi:hypothetical protein
MSRKNEEKSYKLMSEELPKSAKRGSEYDGLLNEFIASNLKTVRVEYPTKTVKALMAGLRSRIKRRALKIRVSIRKGNLYLTKI